jgi:predicted transcriptional regulator
MQIAYGGRSAVWVYGCDEVRIVIDIMAPIRAQTCLPASTGIRALNQAVADCGSAVVAVINRGVSRTGAGGLPVVMKDIICNNRVVICTVNSSPLVCGVVPGKGCIDQG